jgi:hypothetical protein
MELTIQLLSFAHNNKNKMESPQSLKRSLSDNMPSGTQEMEMPDFMKKIKRTKRDPSKGFAHLLDELKRATTKKARHEIREDIIDRLVALMVDLSDGMDDDAEEELPELDAWYDDLTGTLKGNFPTSTYISCVQVELDQATNKEAAKVAPMAMALIKHLVKNRV